ncbi:unnamed protein product [Eruca vesicaria subsp. sativa]|uniref:TF-B3 domain-containing protein n=1 Tax=Eruca vesicaria subsp. sativa TaxID=29727 RepID=A0ABC8J8Z4_ERUVS|nr:unnamed protein product [Eruca vesicaria subsp. sativa]
MCHLFLPKALPFASPVNVDPIETLKNQLVKASVSSSSATEKDCEKCKAEWAKLLKRIWALGPAFTKDQTYYLLQMSPPALFVRENSINKPGEIFLLGKDGTKWPTSLLQKNRGRMRLGNGWKEFVKANDSTNDKEQEEYLKSIKKQSLFIDPTNRNNGSNDENNKEDNVSWERKKRGRDSTPSSIKQFVTLTITPSSVTSSIEFHKEKMTSTSL